MSLFGAINIGLSGMDAYSNGLQVISNNVANLNTLGYKAQTVTFDDIVNSGGGGLTYTPPDTGDDGVKLNPTTTDFTQGTLEQTGNALDLAMSGDGFLVLQSNGETFYTRTGSFSVGDKGFISLEGQPAGSTYNLALLNSSSQPTAVDVNSFQTSPPTATTTITLGQNLSSTATTDSVSNVTVYDSTGDAHTWTITLTPSTSTSGTSASQTWNVAVTDETGASIGSGTITFNGSVAASSSAKITVNDQPTDGAAALAVVLDFSNVTSFDAGSTSTLQTTSVDGNAVGSLSTVTVNSSGHVILSYSNNLTKDLGAVAIANFQNPEDLKSLGGGLYANPKNAAVTLNASGDANAGSVVSAQLETSNVNLTSEFGSLILIQRGFQASSEVVSVSNDMIQQLFGIRGQGG